MNWQNRLFNKIKIDQIIKNNNLIKPKNNQLDKNNQKREIKQI